MYNARILFLFYVRNDEQIRADVPHSCETAGHGMLLYSIQAINSLAKLYAPQ